LIAISKFPLFRVPPVNPNISPGTPFFDDLLAIFRALNVVTNNGIGRVGGGGTPRRPPPPPICGAESS
jgi:hypothetical protein